MNLTKVSPEFATDFAELVNGLKGIDFNAEVDYQTKNGGRKKFKYVTLDRILLEIKKNHNFAIIVPLGTNDRGESALQIILMHRTGETITSDYYRLRVPETGTKQDEGAAITYTKRYALGSFLGLCTDQDNDSNPDGNGSGAITPPPPPPPVKYITREQRQELSKLSTDKWGDKALDEFERVTGYKSTKEIKATEYQTVLEKLKQELARE